MKQFSICYHLFYLEEEAELSAGTEILCTNYNFREVNWDKLEFFIFFKKFSHDVLYRFHISLLICGGGC